MSVRSINVKLATCEEGIRLTITEKETVTAEDEGSGGSHTEQEKFAQTFAVYKSAAEAADKTVRKFESKLKAKEGELFG
jgi:hypothetical protein